MRLLIINYLKQHTFILRIFWKIAEIVLTFLSRICQIKQKTILFSSFGGRKFDDSPKALYDEICDKKEFDDWNLIWAFVEPEKFSIPRGIKIKIDTLSFFKALLSSHVWVSNTGMARGINVNNDNIIKIETWHGCPLKKIGGEENQTSLGGKPKEFKGILDNKTIRCAQSEYDRDIFARIFHAAKESFLMCDLPRNDSLLKYSKDDCEKIKNRLGLPKDKKIILYTPTYREYLVDEYNSTYIAPPLNLEKWQNLLGSKYIFLIRAHYAVNKALNIVDNDFVRNVSDYECLNDLFVISDLMISDYSSTFFDYSILGKPMLCFAYDLEEYEEKRGLYLNLQEALPCKVDKNEDELIEHIFQLDFSEASKKSNDFRKKYVPNAGKASRTIVDELLKRLGLNWKLLYEK